MDRTLWFANPLFFLSSVSALPALNCLGLRVQGPAHTMGGLLHFPQMFLVVISRGIFIQFDGCLVNYCNFVLG